MPGSRMTERSSLGQSFGGQHLVQLLDDALGVLAEEAAGQSLSQPRRFALLAGAELALDA